MSGIAQLKSALEAFNRSGATDETARPLRAMRRSLAELFFALDAAQAAARFNGEVAEAHRLLVSSGLRDLPRHPDEKALADRVKQALDARPAAPGALLAAALLFQAFELTVEEDLRRIPPWFLADYASFLLAAPALFDAQGDARRYHDCTTAAVAAIHRYVMHDPEPPFASELRTRFFGELLLTQIYFNECNLKDMYRQRAQIFEGWAFEHGALLAHCFPPRPASAAGQRLRIGILSNHVEAQTETYFMLAHFERFPRERCTLFLYTTHDEATPLSKYARSVADQSVQLPVDTPALAVERIRNDDLDVLLIGSNVTASLRNVAYLAGHRLARTQVICGSSPVTTGLTTADWYLSAQESETEARAQAEYTEEVYRMPGMLTRYAYHLDKDPRTVVGDRADLGIPENAIVFFSASNYFKVIPELSLTWARIMAQLPEARLLLMPFNRNWALSYMNGPFSARVFRQIREAGGNPDHVHFVDAMPTRADLHGIMALADVYLDSYPFAGACSLLDAILVGLPIVARTGRNFRGDVGAGMLRGLGLGDMAVADEQAYISRAIALAQDAGLRAREQERIRAAISPDNPIFDSQTASRNMEAACVDMAARTNALEQALMRWPADRLRAAVDRLGTELARDRNTWFRALNDVELVRLIVVPYFQSLPDDGRHRRMIDVGACVGQMTTPFLEMGWRADLFEPDPACRQALAELAARYGGRAVVNPAVVSDAGTDSMTFYRSAMGLSGLSPSPYGATEATLSVPVVRLDEYTRTRALEHLDFLKVDAEGWDFDALRSHDFDRLPVRLAMVEFGTEFDRQSPPSILEAITAMNGKGYEALVLSYEDNGNYKRQVWRHDLIAASFGKAVTRKDGHAAGNIIFFRRHDEVFLRVLFRLLVGFLPPRERRRHYAL